MKSGMTMSPAQAIAASRTISPLLESAYRELACALGDTKNPLAWETTVTPQPEDNARVRDGVHGEEFVTMRTDHDRRSRLPDLTIPATRVTVRGCRLPEPVDKDVGDIRLPLGAS